jgi:hypothetical protein
LSSCEEEIKASESPNPPVAMIVLARTGVKQSRGGQHDSNTICGGGLGIGSGGRFRSLAGGHGDADGWGEVRRPADGCASGEARRSTHGYAWGEAGRAAEASADTHRDLNFDISNAARDGVADG